MKSITGLAVISASKTGHLLFIIKLTPGSALVPAHLFAVCHHHPDFVVMVTAHKTPGHWGVCSL